MNSYTRRILEAIEAKLDFTEVGHRPYYEGFDSQDEAYWEGFEEGRSWAATAVRSVDGNTAVDVSILRERIYAVRRDLCVDGPPEFQRGIFEGIDLAIKAVGGKIPVDR